MVGDQGSNLGEGTAPKREWKPFVWLAVYCDKIEAWQLLVSVEVEATGTGFGFGLGRSGCRTSDSEWKRVGPATRWLSCFSARRAEHDQLQIFTQPRVLTRQEFEFKACINWLLPCFTGSRSAERHKMRRQLVARESKV